MHTFIRKLSLVIIITMLIQITGGYIAPLGINKAFAAGDIAPPTAPTDLQAVFVNYTSVELIWTPSTDDISLSGYEIFRDGNKIGATNSKTTTYISKNLVPGKTYLYTIKAYDADGNRSEPSNVLATTTTEDTQLPTVPENLTNTNITETQISLSWSGSTDDIGLKGYEVYRDGVKIAGTNANTTTYTNSSLIPGKSYEYSIKSYDLAGNKSDNSTPITVTTNPDTVNPTTPSNIVSSNITSTEATISWEPSTDNLAVKGYNIYRDGMKVGGANASTTSYTLKSLIPGGSYEISIEAYDIALNKSELSSPVVIATLPDLEAPTIPMNLSLSNVTQTEVSLSWEPSTDNNQVKGYEIYRDGGKIAGTNSITTTYTNKGLVPGRSYQYTVSAFDIAGNKSIESLPLLVTTVEDPIPPIAPNNLTATDIAETSITLSWDASFDNVSLKGYEIYRDGKKIGGTNATSASFISKNLIPGQTYQYTVLAYDIVGNKSIESAPLTITTVSDQESPTMPIDLEAVVITETQVTLTWTGSIDNTVVKGYEIFRDNVKIGATNSSTYSYTSKNLIPGTNYNYVVKAYDIAGNRSVESNIESVTTVIDPEAPTIPTNLVAMSSSERTVSLTWVAAIDNVGLKGYEIFRDGVKIARTSANITSYVNVNLIPGKTYTYTVRAYDIAGNRSDESEPTTVMTISDLEAPTIPADLSYSNITETQVTLSWGSSTDNISLKGYEILRNGTKIAATNATTITYTVKNLKPNTSYEFSVRAYDIAGNRSEIGNSISITTIKDEVSPSTPDNLKVTEQNETSITISWSPSVDNVAIKRYEVFKDGVKIGSTTSRTTSFTVTGLVVSNSYGLTVKAFDTSENYSDLSDELFVQLISPIPVPENVTGIALDAASIKLTWDQVDDSDSYEILADGVTKSVTLNEFIDQGLLPNSSHSYQVRAVIGQNASQWSPILSITTPDQAVLSMNAEAGYDNVKITWDSRDGVVGYEIEADGVIHTVFETTYILQDLKPGTTHTYRLREIYEGYHGLWTSLYEVTTLSNKVTINGDLVLEHNQTYADLDIQSGTIDLNGFTLTVQGDLIHSGGNININGGRLNVYGNYRIQSVNDDNGSVSYSESSGLLTMNQENDYVLVYGDFITQTSAFVEAPLTSGTIELRGSFIQKGNELALTPFWSYEKNRILISGDASQTVRFEDVFTSCIAVFEITNSSDQGVTLETPVNVISELKSTESIINDSRNVQLCGVNAIITGGAWHYDLTGSYLCSTDTTIEGNFYTLGLFKIEKDASLMINGNFYVNGYVSNLGKLEIDGDFILSRGTYFNGLYVDWETDEETKSVSSRLIVHRNLNIVDGYFDNRSNMTIDGDTVIDNGGLCLNIGDVVINGNVKQNGGMFINNAASCKIKGNYELVSGSFSGNFEAYTMAGKTEIEQNLMIDNGSIDLNGIDLSIVGDLIQNNGCIETSGTIEILGNYYFKDGVCQLDGHVAASNIVQENGRMYLFYYGSMTVENDYRIQSMTISDGGDIIYSDCNGVLGLGKYNYVLVKGDFITQSNIDHLNYSYTIDYYSNIITVNGALNGGILEVRGDFSQKLGMSDDSKNNFASLPYSDFTVILRGDSKQNVLIEDPTNSGFNILAISNPLDSGYTFSEKPVWRRLIQLDKVEAHFGQDGAYGPTGNYSKSFTDMTSSVPGFKMVFSRTYNSLDKDSGILGRGWTQGFESKIKDSGANKTIKLPDGSTLTFVLQADGSYKGYGNFSTFRKENDGTYLLTTTDQYQYGFSQSRYLIWMKDRNGNAISINRDLNNRITSITDSSHNSYDFTYTADGLLSAITDPVGRNVNYQYENGKLANVIDPEGSFTHYYYDDIDCLIKITDNSDNPIETIEYENLGNDQYKVKSITDQYGNKRTYQYDSNNCKTTITDSLGRKEEQFYDDSFCIIKQIDAEGRQTLIEYEKDSDGLNTLMQQKSITDRNGNLTQFEYDSRGNKTKITNPDGSCKTMVYDDNNNLTSERDECGNFTYYIYDDNKLKLMKKVQPLNGTDAFFIGCDESKFAITCYDYYSDGENGYTIKGLQKSITDPEGNTTTYTYDASGNTKTVSDPETLEVLTYEYNTLGWKTAEISPRGFRTEYYYDMNGNVVKVIKNASSATPSVYRTVFDDLGRKVQEISPNEYDASKDELDLLAGINTYNDTTAGTRYVYNDNGTLRSLTDPENNTISYRYDLYGNVESETKPNGALYYYHYDVMNRPVQKTFFDGSTTYLLEEYQYAVLADKTTATTFIKYLTETEKASTTITYDYAGREIKRIKPDNTEILTTFNQNGTVSSVKGVNGGTTYNRYDGLNRLTEQWAPFEQSGPLYSYKKITYDRAGRQKMVQIGRQLVSLYALPSSFSETVYDYYKNGKVKAIYQNGRFKAEYQYDNDGNVSEEKSYTSATAANVVQYTNDYQGKPLEQKVIARKGDIGGNLFSDNTNITLTTTYTYDLNGNLKTVQTPNQVITTYSYDKLNRQISVSQPGIDEAGNPATIITSQTYDWEGKVLTSTDPEMNVTSYVYNKRGFLEKVNYPDNGTAAFWYDVAGRKVSEVSPNNYDSSKTLQQMNRVIYTYDSMDRVITKTFSGVEKVYNASLRQWVNQSVTIVQKAYQYDNSGNVVKELDALGFEAGTGDVAGKISTGYGTTTTYNLANMVKTVCDPVNAQNGLSFIISYTYDGLGQILTETNANGAITIYEYDNDGNVVKVQVKANASATAQTIRQATYDYLGNALTVTDGNNNTTTNEYNALNKIRSTVYPGDATIPSNTVISQYDVMGNLVAKQDSLGRIDEYTYDKQGRNLALKVRNSDSSKFITTSASYDLNGNKRFVTDGNLTTSENRYDSMNRLSDIYVTVSGVLHHTHYTYDKNGNQTSITDWRGNTSTLTYDALNRLILKTDPYGKCIQKLVYSHNNTQTISYDALDNETQFTCDRNNRLLLTIDPELHTTKQTYDNVGNIKTKVDGKNNTTTYTYDEFNRLTKVTNAKNENTSYTYDLNGNMLSQTDGKGNVQYFEYNVANKLIRKIDAGGRTGTPGSYTYNPAKTEAYTYYADGNLQAKTDRNGKTTNYTYDIFGRLTELTVDSITISYTYDKNGNQLTMQDCTGTTTREYDELNRVTQKTVPHIGTSIYAYDITTGMAEGCYGERTTDPMGNVVLKVYDKLGRLIEVTSNGDTTTYEYYDNGNRKSVVYGSGLREDYTYYKDNLLHTLINKKADGSIIDSYTYTYDAAHNQLIKIDIKGTTTYGYDVLNRLGTVSEPTGRSVSYTYDAAGNRLTETIVVGTQTTVNNYSYNEQNRLFGIITKVNNVQTANTTYTYDNNGNQLVTTVNNVIQLTNTYNVLNQLSRTEKGSDNILYKYNADGYRVEKSVNGTITRYLYEADKVILEVNNSGTQEGSSVYGLNLIKRTVAGATYSYLYNGHADVTALISSAGSVAATYYYDAFGNVLEQTGNVNNIITFAGYQYDKETGLYYLNARYYDSITARFVSEDTFRGDLIDPLSLNLYTYCSNNPIKFTDPTGHWQKGDEGLNDDAKAQIIALGNAWVAADTIEEKKAISQQADNIRKAQEKDANGNYVKRDTVVDIQGVWKFDVAMVAAMADGKLTREEDLAAQALIGVKTESSTTINTNYSLYANESLFSSTTTIGKAEINVSIKSLQGKNTNNISSISNVNIDLKTHFSAYVFYLPEWENEKDNNVDALCKFYGIDRNDIGTASVTSNDSLKNSWNSIGLTEDGNNVSAVILNTHGNGEVLAYGNGNQTTSFDIAGYQEKNIDNLIVLGCNAGHLDHTSNPAASFARRINGGNVFASDGKVINYNEYFLFGPMTYVSAGEKAFKENNTNGLNGSNRDNVGWIVYKEENGRITTTSLHDTNMSIESMLINLK